MMIAGWGMVRGCGCVTVGYGVAPFTIRMINRCLLPLPTVITTVEPGAAGGTGIGVSLLPGILYETVLEPPPVDTSTVQSFGPTLMVMVPPGTAVPVTRSPSPL